MKSGLYLLLTVKTQPQVSRPALLHDGVACVHSSHQAYQRLLALAPEYEACQRCSSEQLDEWEHNLQNGL